MNSEQQEPQQHEGPETQDENDKQEPQDQAPAPTAPVTAPPPPPPPPPSHHAAHTERRLVRRPQGKIIAGVCTGLGAYTGTDPVVWRIGFVVLALTTGIGLIGYIVAWLVMPMARPGEPVPEHPHSLNAGRWIGIGAILLGGLIFARQVFNFHTSWFWGILLIGIGLALWGRDWSRPGRGNGATPPRPPSAEVPDESPPPVTPAPSSAPFAATAPFSQTTATVPLDRPDDVAPTATEPLMPPPPPPPVPPAKKRPPSILGRLVVGACALAIGGALLLNNLGVVHTTPKAMIGLLLGIVGAGLLVGTKWGRAKWLIAPGIVLALMLTTVTAIPFNTRGGFGNANWEPTSLRTVRRTYEHAAGPAKLDLSHVKFGNRTREITVRLGFGPLLIEVPKDVNVLVDGHVQGGPMSLFGRNGAGWDISNSVESRVKGAEATLRIHARVTFGPLLVDRSGNPVIERFKGRNFNGNEFDSMEAR